jgi:hypothetical protein
VLNKKQSSKTLRDGVESYIDSKNPKTQSLIKLLQERERAKVTICEHQEIKSQTKKQTEKYRKMTEKYQPQDLINRIKTEDNKTRKRKWHNSENNMKNKKKVIEWNKDTKKMKRRDHGYIIIKQDNNECPFCNVRLVVDHILWDCKEREAERQRAKIQNNIWDKRKNGMKQLIENVIKIDFYQGM